MTITLESRSIELPANRFALGKSATIALVTFLSVVGCALAEFPAWDQSAIYAAANIVATACYVPVGLRLWLYDNERRLGAGLAIIGVLWSLSFVSVWNTGPWPVVGQQFDCFFYVIGGWALLHYPGTLKLRKGDYATIASLACIPIGQVLINLVSRPEWSHFSKSTWWPHIIADRALFHAFTWGVYLVEIPISIAIAYRMWLRWKMIRGVDRVVAIPIIVGVCAVGLLASLSQRTELVPGPQVDLYFFVLTIGILLIPIGYVTTDLVKRLQHSAVADSVNETLATESPSLGLIEMALRKALHDPTLRVFYWVPESGIHIDGRGITAERVGSDNAFHRSVQARDGTPLAIVTGEAALNNHPTIVQTALNASAIALENARLQASVLSQLDEVRESRTRIAQAALDERRRIEGDLHDGIQQRLLALSTQLGTLERAVVDESTRQRVSELGKGLRSTLDELRDLVRGIHPTELRQFGLSAAVNGVVERLGLPVDVNVVDARFAPTIEATAYFFVCEALTNSVKHSNATSAFVSASIEGSTLEIIVGDDGIGGADVSGRGLTGLADRVRSIGGAFSMSSDDKHSTLLKAVIPCQ